MGAKSKIEWTDATWNPIRGCSRVSEGCRNCYAEAIAARFSGPGLPYEGLAVMKNGKPHWTGEVRLIEKALDLPLRWREPKKIFVNSVSDLFHEKVPYEWVDRIFAVMAMCTRHTYQVLTKRPERMKGYMSRPRPHFCRCTNCGAAFNHNTTRNALTCICPSCKSEDKQIPSSAGWPLPNVWLGVSVEDQKTADKRIPSLLQTPAAIRWVSYEPALGPVDFSHLRSNTFDALCGRNFECLDHDNTPKLNWVVCGGESGPGARPMDPEWARSLRDQCWNACLPFFMKQMGGRFGHNDTPIPKDLDIREFPEE